MITRTAARIERGRVQAAQEVLGLGAVGMPCEQFFELVDDEEQFSFVRRHDQARGAQEPALVAPQLFHETGRPVHRHAQQADLQLVQRVRAGHHLDHEPSLRPRQSAPARAGSNPALTTDDLPLPLGPTTARKRTASPERSAGAPASGG
jgi:hypothetical protein